MKRERGNLIVFACELERIQALARQALARQARRDIRSGKRRSRQGVPQRSAVGAANACCRVEDWHGRGHQETTWPEGKVSHV